MLRLNKLVTDLRMRRPKRVFFDIFKKSDTGIYQNTLSRSDFHQAIENVIKFHGKKIIATA